MNHTKKFAASLISLAILLFCTNTVVVHAQAPIKVAILPVKINALEKMDYLQGGLMDMLESHIGGQDIRQVQEGPERNHRQISS